MVCLGSSGGPSVTSPGASNLVSLVPSWVSCGGSSGTSLGPLWRAPPWHLLRHSKSILSMLLEGSSVAFWLLVIFWFLLLILLYVLGAGLSGGAAGRLSMGKGTWNSWRELRGDERSEAPRSGWSNDMFVHRQGKSGKQRQGELHSGSFLIRSIKRCCI